MWLEALQQPVTNQMDVGANTWCQSRDISLSCISLTKTLVASVAVHEKQVYLSLLYISLVSLLKKTKVDNIVRETVLGLRMGNLLTSTFSVVCPPCKSN